MCELYRPKPALVWKLWRIQPFFSSNLRKLQRNCGCARAAWFRSPPKLWANAITTIHWNCYMERWTCDNQRQYWSDTKLGWRPAEGVSWWTANRCHLGACVQNSDEKPHTIGVESRDTHRSRKSEEAKSGYLWLKGRFSEDSHPMMSVQTILVVVICQCLSLEHLRPTDLVILNALNPLSMLPMPDLISKWYIKSTRIPPLKLAPLWAVCKPPSGQRCHLTAHHAKFNEKM